MFEVVAGLASSEASVLGRDMPPPPWVFMPPRMPVS